jgi:hypothetical protein
MMNKRSKRPEWKNESILMLFTRSIINAKELAGLLTYTL